jgi:hypothetical protein
MYDLYMLLKYISSTGDGINPIWKDCFKTLSERMQIVHEWPCMIFTVMFTVMNDTIFMIALFMIS